MNVTPILVGLQHGEEIAKIVLILLQISIHIGIETTVLELGITFVEYKHVEVP